MLLFSHYPTELQSPDAEERDIKRAYYSIMRDCHPDQSGDNEEANEFCKMLNEIYEVFVDVHVPSPCIIQG
jgi:DnaJ-class molecular chaperone